MKPPTVFGLREQGAMLLAVERLGDYGDWLVSPVENDYLRRLWRGLREVSR